MTILLILAALCIGVMGGWAAMRIRAGGQTAQMVEMFRTLSAEILERNNKTFLDLAKGSLEKYQEGAKADLEGRHKAIASTLQQLDMHQRELEKKREGAYAGLSKQMELMLTSERELRRETAQLVQALRSPQARGSWGEMHLRRVVEMAGLLNHCDFVEQKHLEADGRSLRPDLIVQLPGMRQIVVDAKTPLIAYLDSTDAGDETARLKKLQEHASALRKHIKDLSSKEYWKQFPVAPEYVILFLPAEAFFSGALQADPTLIEGAASQSIILATPTTLIAILRAVAFSWKQEGLSKSAQEIAKLGQELYDRIGIVCDHWSRVGKGLSGAVEAYNQSVASLETRVLVSTRKLKEVASIAKEIAEPEPVEKLTRTITAP